MCNRIHNFILAFWKQNSLAQTNYFEYEHYTIQLEDIGDFLEIDYWDSHHLWLDFAENNLDYMEDYKDKVCVYVNLLLYRVSR